MGTKNLALNGGGYYTNIFFCRLIYVYFSAFKIVKFVFYRKIGHKVPSTFWMQ